MHIILSKCFLVCVVFIVFLNYPCIHVLCIIWLHELTICRLHEDVIWINNSEDDGDMSSSRGWSLWWLHKWNDSTVSRNNLKEQDIAWISFTLYHMLHYKVKKDCDIPVFANGIVNYTAVKIVTILLNKTPWRSNHDQSMAAITCEIVKGVYCKH